jgi:hypothetical protein
MQPRNNEPLERWIRAERAGDDAEADRLFRSVAANIPRLSPAPGFASRTLAAVGVVGAASAAGVWSAWWMYALVGTALSLAATAVATVSLPALLSAGVGFIHTVAIAASAVWTWVGTVAGAAWSIFRALAQVGGALNSAINVPAAGAFVVVNLVVASLSLLALRRLLVPQRRVTS